MKNGLIISVVAFSALLLSSCGINDSDGNDPSVRLYIEGDIDSRMDDRLLKNYRTMFSMNIDSQDGVINEALTIGNIAILSELAGGNHWNLYFRFFERIEEKVYTTNYTTLLQYREEIGERTLIYTFRSESGTMEITEFNADYMSVKVNIPLELEDLTERLDPSSPVQEVENFEPKSVTLTGSFVMHLN